MAKMLEVTESMVYFGGKVLPTHGHGCERKVNSNSPCREWQDPLLDETFMGLTLDHCYQSQDKQGSIDSTIVGLIHNDNSVGDQFEAEV